MSIIKHKVYVSRKPSTKIRRERERKSCLENPKKEAIEKGLIIVGK